MPKQKRQLKYCGDKCRAFVLVAKSFEKGRTRLSHQAHGCRCMTTDNLRELLAKVHPDRYYWNELTREKCELYSKLLTAAIENRQRKQYHDELYLAGKL